jgi:hypothetical protein
MSYAACLPLLRVEWAMSATAAGSIATGFQIGYAFSLLVAEATLPLGGYRLAFLATAAGPVLGWSTCSFTFGWLVAWPIAVVAVVVPSTPSRPSGTRPRWGSSTPPTRPASRQPPGAGPSSPWAPAASSPPLAPGRSGERPGDAALVQLEAGAGLHRADAEEAPRAGPAVGGRLEPDGALRAAGDAALETSEQVEAAPLAAAVRARHRASPPEPSPGSTVLDECAAVAGAGAAERFYRGDKTR